MNEWKKTKFININYFDSPDQINTIIQNSRKIFLVVENVVSFLMPYCKASKDVTKAFFYTPWKRIPFWFLDVSIIGYRNAALTWNSLRLMDGVQLPQGYNHFEKASSQKFLVLILWTSKRWQTESTLEPPSGFEHGTPGLGIQHLNH